MLNARLDTCVHLYLFVFIGLFVLIGDIPCATHKIGTRPSSSTADLLKPAELSFIRKVMTDSS
jgi:hypothetical protein